MHPNLVCTTYLGEIHINTCVLLSGEKRRLNTYYIYSIPNDFRPFITVLSLHIFFVAFYETILSKSSLIYSSSTNTLGVPNVQRIRNPPTTENVADAGVACCQCGQTIIVSQYSIGRK